MTHTIKPSMEKELDEIQDTCPACGFDMYSEHTYVPSRYINGLVHIYECVNKHSWEKRPGSIKSLLYSEPRVLKANKDYTTQNVWRPLHDTKEPVKRLFGSN